MSAHDKTLHKSALFLISEIYGQAVEDISRMRPPEKMASFDGNHGFICRHTVSKGETSSDRLPNALVLCIVAPLTQDQISRRWEQLGASVMQTIKLHNSSGGFRVNTLRIKKWVGRDSSASTSFLRGMCSEADHMSIQRILAPCKMLC
jgi:hypothetical protein